MHQHPQNRVQPSQRTEGIIGPHGRLSSLTTDSKSFIWEICGLTSPGAQPPAWLHCSLDHIGIGAAHADLMSRSRLVATRSGLTPGFRVVFRKVSSSCRSNRTFNSILAAFEPVAILDIVVRQRLVKVSCHLWQPSAHAVVTFGTRTSSLATRSMAVSPSSGSGI